ncbi:MAG: hypothetical protein RLZZ481_2283 [Pseudomonadota bacterium]|jgi:hypothetical protein
MGWGPKQTPNELESVRNSFDGAALTTPQTAQGVEITVFLLLVCGRDANHHHYWATTLGYVRIFTSTDQSIYISKQFFCK